MQKETYRSLIRTGVAATVILLVQSHASIHAMPQRLMAGSSSGESAKGASSNIIPADMPDKNRIELEARIEALSRQVAALQQMVETMMAQISGTQAAAVTVAKAPADHSEPAPREPGEGSGNGGGGSAPLSASSATIQAQPARGETASRSLEPLRFGGDLRLRLDGILRSAYNSTDPGRSSMPHAQNIRGRYRFRFNMDADVNPAVSFHAQLTTGQVNNPLTLDQDFTATTVHHAFLVNEAWVDIRPRKGIYIQGGRVQEVFADNLRFLFDDDITFNGFNERYSLEFGRSATGFRRIEFRAGQYVFSNPNIAVVTASNLGLAGAVIGSTGRAAQMFHQGLILEQALTSKATQQFGADIQAFRNPSQIQFASTAAGLPVMVQNGLGITLSGPIAGSGNATTTPGGAIYSARNFQVARLTYRLDYTGLKSARQEYPITLNLQLARNVGTGQPERDALLANLKIGRVSKRGDYSFLYTFGIKGANSMISQFTDDDFGTATGVNIRTHYFRFDLGLAKGIQLQNLLFIQNALRNSGQFPNFFVPLGGYAPRQYRFQEQIVFVF